MTVEKQFTYCHPDNPNVRFRDIGTPPPWAVDVQPYVEAPKHPSDPYTDSMNCRQIEKFRELWDFMVARGVEEHKIVELLDLHKDGVKYNF